MKRHIESQAEAHKRRVILTSISEGGTFCQHFLNSVSQKWKDDHILGWLSLSTPFTGATEIGLHLLSGDPGYNIPWLTPAKFRDASAAWPGLAVVSPQASGNSTEDSKIFIKSPSRNFSIADFPAALKAGSRTTTLEVLADVTETLKGRDLSVAPGVRLYCMHVSKVQEKSSPKR